MNSSTSRNIRLGILMIAGVLFFITGLYLIGDKQNLFGSTIQVKANFSNVNGLNRGNNVRYAGIDVGTVNNVQIMNDSMVLVEMTIESEATSFIRTNAIASIGTDGLMGNKLVNINSVPGDASYIQEGDILESIAPLDADRIMRTLSQTNEDMYLIAENLKKITDKIEQENMVWNLLADSAISKNIKNTMKNIEYTTSDLTNLTQSFKNVVEDIQTGKGMVGALLYDTVLINKMDDTFSNIQEVSDSLARLTNDISDIANQVKKGEGAIGKVLSDEQFNDDLSETVTNMKNASHMLEENLEALKHNVLFRRYFKKKEKEEKKKNQIP